MELAYQPQLALIEQILTCQNGQLDQLLEAHAQLITPDLLRVMIVVSQHLHNEGLSNEAEFLEELASRLTQWFEMNRVETDSVSANLAFDFLMQLLAATEQKPTPEHIYPLLDQQPEMLTWILIPLLQQWADATLPVLEAEAVQSVASTLFRFCGLFRDYPKCPLDLRLEIVISGYKVSLPLFRQEALLVHWARTQVNLGNAYCDRILGSKSENLEQAIQCYQQALQVYKHETNPEDWADTKMNLGIAYSDNSLKNRHEALEKAIACHQQAIQVYTLENIPLKWAMVRVNLGNAYCDRILGDKSENFEQAIQYYQQALQVCKSETNSEEWALIQNNLGTVYLEYTQGNKAENLELALDYLKNSLRVYTPETYPYEWARTQLNLSNVYRDRTVGEKAENLELALDYLKNSLRVYTSETYLHEWARAMIGLGSLYRNRVKGDRSENFDQSIYCYQESLRIFTYETSPYIWAGIKSNLGNIYTYDCDGTFEEQRENLEFAISCYEDSLKVFTTQDYLWAIIQTNMGNAYHRRIQGEKSENLEKAITCHQKALQAFSHNNFSYDRAVIKLNLGNVYVDRIIGKKSENLEYAISCYHQILQVFNQEQFPYDWAQVQTALGNAYRESNQGDRTQNLGEAICCYNNALEVLKPATLPYECLRAARELGNLMFTEGWWGRAIEVYQKAITAIELSRSWAKTDRRRQEVLEASMDVYENLVQSCINIGNLELALQTVERCRSRHLVDLMATPDLYLQGNIPPEITELLQTYAALEREIYQRQFPPDSSPLRTESFPTPDHAQLAPKIEEIAALEAQKQAIWLQLRQHDPVLAGQIQVTPLQFSEFQELLKEQPQTALLCCYTTRQDTHLLILRHSAQPEATVACYLHTCTGQGIDEFQNWLLKSWFAPYLDDRRAWQDSMPTLLAELSQRLQLASLIQTHLQGIKELIIIPHLALHQIPFAALPVTDSTVLADHFRIRPLPSCQILQYCQQRPPGPPDLHYGIAEHAAADLAFTPYEAEQVAQLFSVRPEHWLQSTTGTHPPTPERYYQLLKQVNALLSTHHASSRIDNPLESQLHLANGTIKLGQLMSPGWRFPQLQEVFLSGCETNLGSVASPTDDLLTLGTGFLCAGARCVISSLWSVGDLSTALFSRFYHEARYQGLDRPTALQNAQKQLRGFSVQELKTLFDSELNPYLDQQFERATARGDRTRKREIDKQQEQLKEFLKLAQDNEFPFASPFYWAAFTCQGLR